MNTIPHDQPDQTGADRAPDLATLAAEVAELRRQYAEDVAILTARVAGVFDIMEAASRARGMEPSPIAARRAFRVIETGKPGRKAARPGLAIAPRVAVTR